jgi:anti-sigma regulatory factor (Ser/Thr protein kinase)
MDGVTYWFRHTAEPRAVPSGRRFASNALRDWGLEHLSESVTLIASELLTNAVEATGTTKAELSRGERETLPLVAVRLRVCTRMLTVEVWDTGRTLPRMRTPDADSENGRGLPIVTLLSERWDSYRHPSGGKVVYAVLSLARPPVAITRETADGASTAAGGIAEPDPRAARARSSTNSPRVPDGSPGRDR